ncbi:MAG: leader peptidase (prepilin peptidase) / N-methyltransferase [Betaproteobacteria bacterium]|jgi:leader peptidase (prepilin peptidase)/N-methyltransferase|nr:leader peptidase (prepilin peptidase) / N-methyltransferase [Betaproteobacteria bacterium]
MGPLGWLAQPSVLPWVVLAFGLCVGSFLNVVIHRLPKMLEREWRAECASLAGQEIPQAEAYNLFVPRSRCPSCGHKITALENVPLFSWAFLRGKCSSCRARISAKYPFVELLAGIAAAYSAWRFGPTLATLGAALFVWFTIALAFIDQETGLLPDDLTLPLVWIGLLLNLWGAFVPIQDAVVGAAAGYLSLWLVYWGFKLLTGKEGMGFGDFKMFAAVGAFLGWKMLPLVLLVSSLVGLVFGAAQMFAARGRYEGSFRFHFGPYIAIAGLIALYWGEPMMRWYMYRM